MAQQQQQQEDGTGFSNYYKRLTDPELLEHLSQIVQQLQARQKKTHNGMSWSAHASGANGVVIPQYLTYPMPMSPPPGMLIHRQQQQQQSALPQPPPPPPPAAEEEEEEKEKMSSAASPLQWSSLPPPSGPKAKPKKKKKQQQDEVIVVDFERRDDPYEKVCSTPEDVCPCRYYFREDEEERPTNINSTALYVMDLPNDKEHAELRTIVIRALGKDCRSTNIFARDYKRFANVYFKTHAQATKAQLKLEQAGYRTNFLLHNNTD